MILMAILKTEQAAAANWTGCYGGGAVGYGSSNTDADLKLAGAGNIEVDGLGTQGANVGLFGGCDIAMQKVVLGTWGDYTWHDTDEFTVSASFPGFSGNIATYSLDTEWSLGARAGFLVTPDVLAYGLVGYAESSWNDLDVLKGFGGPSFSIPDMTGIVWGGGMEASLGNGLFVRGEYRYTDYDSESIDVIPGFAKLDLDPDVQTARVGLAYKFNFTNDIGSVPMK